MKKILLYLALASMAIAQTAKNRTNLYSDISTNLPTNGSGAITAATMRAMLGEIVASGYNPLTDGVFSFTANSTGFSLAGGTTSKTLTISSTLTFAGTDGTTITFPSTSATMARTDASNIFTGHQTIEGVTSTGATGIGAFVFSNSPTLVTPVLGVATATSINGNVWTTGTGTLTLGAGKTLTASNTLTLTGTDGSSVNFGTGGTVLYSGGSYVSSLAGTINQITASASTGSVALSLAGPHNYTTLTSNAILTGAGTGPINSTGWTIPSSVLTSPNGITFTDTSGALSIVANGTNKSITLSPTGNAAVIIGQTYIYPTANVGAIAIGPSALKSETTGTNIAIGYQALQTATSPNSNIAIGYQALAVLDGSGNDDNLAMGFYGLTSLTAGSRNTVLGYRSGQSPTSTSDNTFIGAYAGNLITTGASNVFIGSQAGYGNTTSNAPVTDNNSVLIGFSANRSVASGTQLTNYIGIGYGVLVSASNSVVIGNSSITENYFNGDVNFQSGHTLYFGTNPVLYGTSNGGTVISTISGGYIQFNNAASTFGIADIYDGTSSTSYFKVNSTNTANNSTSGAFVVGNGAAGTSVAIGGGNINAGGTGIFGGLITANAGLTVSSGQTLQLGNAVASSTPVGTGTVAMKDSTGSTIYVMVSTIH